MQAVAGESAEDIGAVGRSEADGGGYRRLGSQRQMEVVAVGWKVTGRWRWLQAI